MRALPLDVYLSTNTPGEICEHNQVCICSPNITSATVKEVRAEMKKKERKKLEVLVNMRGKKITSG